MQISADIRRTVMLWAVVTLVLWAALPLAISHSQWFGWMPSWSGARDNRAIVAHHNIPGPMLAAMLMLISSTVLSVVLLLSSFRGRQQHS